MKRKLSLVLGAVLLAGLVLTGCKPKDTDEGTQPPAEQVAPPNTEVPATTSETPATTEVPPTT